MLQQGKRNREITTNLILRRSVFFCCLSSLSFSRAALSHTQLITAHNSVCLTLSQSASHPTNLTYTLRAYCHLFAKQTYDGILQHFFDLEKALILCIYACVVYILCTVLCCALLCITLHCFALYRWALFEKRFSFTSSLLTQTRTVDRPSATIYFAMTAWWLYSESGLTWGVFPIRNKLAIEFS